MYFPEFAPLPSDSHVLNHALKSLTSAQDWSVNTWIAESGVGPDETIDRNGRVVHVLEVSSHEQDRTQVAAECHSL